MNRLLLIVFLALGLAACADTASVDGDDVLTTTPTLMSAPPAAPTLNLTVGDAHPGQTVTFTVDHVGPSQTVKVLQGVDLGAGCHSNFRNQVVGRICLTIGRPHIVAKATRTQTGYGIVTMTMVLPATTPVGRQIAFQALVTNAAGPLTSNMTTVTVTATPLPPVEQHECYAGSTPASYIVLPGSTGNKNGVWECEALNGDDVIRSLDFNVEGNEAIYMTYDVLVNGTRVTVASSMNGHFHVTGLNVVIPQGKTIKIETRGDAAAPWMSVGPVASGDTSRLVLVAATGIGVASGEITYWNGDEPGTTTTLYNTDVMAGFPANQPSGLVFPNSRQELMRYSVTCNPAGDCDLITSTIGFTSTDGSNTGWNTCGEIGATVPKLYNLFDFGLTQAVADGEWLTDGDVSCAVASPDAPVRSFVLQSTSGTIATVASGTTDVFAVYIDTASSNAWPSYQDQMYGSMIPYKSMWSDGYATSFWWTVPSGPIVGRTLFY